MRNFFRLILTAVVLASCSSTPAASSGADVKGVTGFDITLVPKADVVDATASDSDAAPDVAATDIPAAADVSVDVPPNCPGAFGCSCQSNSDCDANF